MLDAFSKIVRQEGVGGLFKGLSPALMRQASYSSIRMVGRLMIAFITPYLDAAQV